MKVIFVASGNKTVGTVSAFVRSQFESLQREGLDMILFPIKGKGWKSYLRAIKPLHKLIIEERPDIVHAHYSTCGVIASVASIFTRVKIVVSILGSFPRNNFKLHWVRFFTKHIWDNTLTKSRRTAGQLGLDLPVIPNGVNLEQFKIIDQKEAKGLCGFEDNIKYVIWCSNPERPEKRFFLAQEAVNLINDKNVVLYPVFNTPHDEVVKYMCAADVLLLTSISEGSPNVIKEAMACNCPIVSTDVGDVAINLNGLAGSYVSATDTPLDISICLQKALSYNKRTEGREQIQKLGLTTNVIAKKIINLYSNIPHISSK